MRMFTKYEGGFKRNWKTFSALVKLPADKALKLYKDMFYDKMHQHIKENKPIHAGHIADLSEFQILAGKVVNIYIQDHAFTEWLIQCAGDVTEDKLLPTRHLVGLKDGEEQDYNAPKCALLHFPVGGRFDESILFSVATRKAGGCSLLVTKPSKPDEDDCLLIPFGAEGDDMIRADRKQHRYEDYFIPAIRVVLGAAMYADCFPEAVVPGIPLQLKLAHNQPMPNSKMLTVVDKVKLPSAGGTHASPVGHFRVGHFRVLKSEKFVNKRFQSVFVRSTFVNGKAETILEPEAMIKGYD